MSLACWVLGHEDDGSEVWNDGYFFGHCRRCDQDLLRTSGEWRSVPPGYRVTWRSGVHRHAIASDFRRNLPRATDEPRRWRLGLHRIGMGAILLPPPTPAEMEEARAERESTAGLPHFLLLGFFAALGLAGSLRLRGRRGAA